MWTAAAARLDGSGCWEPRMWTTAAAGLLLPAWDVGWRTGDGAAATSPPDLMGLAPNGPCVLFGYRLTIRVPVN
jgi:hypothetical protein